MELLLILIESVLECLEKEGFLVFEHPLSFQSRLLEFPLQTFVLRTEVSESGSFQLVVSISQLQIFDERLHFRDLLAKVNVLVAHLTLQGLLMLPCMLKICCHLRYLSLELRYHSIALLQLLFKILDAVKEWLL